MLPQTIMQRNSSSSVLYLREITELLRLRKKYLRVPSDRATRICKELLRILFSYEKVRKI